MECCICFDECNNNVTVCGHAVCEQCLDKIVRCPMCRRVLKCHMCKKVLENQENNVIVNNRILTKTDKIIMSITGIMVASVIMVLGIVYF